MKNRITDLIDDADNMGTKEHFHAFANAVITEFSLLSLRTLPGTPSVVGMIHGAYEDGTKPDELAAYLCDQLGEAPQEYENWFPYEENNN